MTKRANDIFFTLLRAAVSGDPVDLFYYNVITTAEWQEVMGIAKKQGLTGVQFGAIERLPKKQMPPKELLLKWLGTVQYIKSRNEIYRKSADLLLNLWLENGLKAVVLKGMVCSSWYPRPELRCLGDLDVFLIPSTPSKSFNHKSTYELGNKVAAEAGAKVEVHDYKHSKISWKSLAVENHKALTEFRGDPKKQDFEKHLQGLLLNENYKDSNLLTHNYILYKTPSAQFNALFLTSHAFMHFMTESIMLRHVCDWAMFLRCNQYEVDWKSFYE